MVDRKQSIDNALTDAINNKGALVKVKKDISYVSTVSSVSVAIHL